MIHPIGDHDHRIYFLQNQAPAIKMERSTDFLGLRWMFVKVCEDKKRPDLKKR
ncbi:MAG: hypothetical protein P8179_04815 [Candidatus Thiodiazotropha sp.]